MKVIVKTPGFYGGTWRDAGKKEVDIPDPVARPFLPPYGNQLAPAPVKKPVAKKAG